MESMKDFERELEKFKKVKAVLGSVNETLLIFGNIDISANKFVDKKLKISMVSSL